MKIVFESLLLSWTTFMALSSKSVAFISVTPLRTRTISSSLAYKPSRKTPYESGGDGLYDQLNTAYEDWCRLHGHKVEPARKEIFSYHFLLAERFHQNTGVRLELNENADLTDPEYARKIGLADATHLERPAAMEAEHEQFRNNYQQWCLKHKKEVDESRLEIFSYHSLLAERHLEETGTVLELNAYADMTEQEYQMELEKDKKQNDSSTPTSGGVDAVERQKLAPNPNPTYEASKNWWEDGNSNNSKEWWESGSSPYASQSRSAQSRWKQAGEHVEAPKSINREKVTPPPPAIPSETQTKEWWGTVQTTSSQTSIPPVSTSSVPTPTEPTTIASSSPKASTPMQNAQQKRRDQYRSRNVNDGWWGGSGSVVSISPYYKYRHQQKEDELTRPKEETSDKEEDGGASMPPMSRKHTPEDKGTTIVPPVSTSSVSIDTVTPRVEPAEETALSSSDNKEDGGASIAPTFHKKTVEDKNITMVPPVSTSSVSIDDAVPIETPIEENTVSPSDTQVDGGSSVAPTFHKYTDEDKGSIVSPRMSTSSVSTDSRIRDVESSEETTVVMKEGVAKPLEEATVESDPVKITEEGKKQIMPSRMSDSAKNRLSEHGEHMTIDLANDKAKVSKESTIESLDSSNEVAKKPEEPAEPLKKEILSSIQAAKAKEILEKTIESETTRPLSSHHKANTIKMGSLNQISTERLDKASASIASHEQRTDIGMTQPPTSTPKPSVSNGNDIRKKYVKWCKVYDKEMSVERMKIFARNSMWAEKYSKDTGIVLELNEHADLREDEYRKVLASTRDSTGAGASSKPSVLSTRKKRGESYRFQKKLLEAQFKYNAIAKEQRRREQQLMVQQQLLAAQFKYNAIAKEQLRREQQLMVQQKLLAARIKNDLLQYQKNKRELLEIEQKKKSDFHEQLLKERIQTKESIVDADNKSSLQEQFFRRPTKIRVEHDERAEISVGLSESEIETSLNFEFVSSYQGLTGPSKAGLVLATAIAVGLVATSPELDLASTIDMSHFPLTDLSGFMDASQHTVAELVHGLQVNLADIGHQVSETKSNLLQSVQIKMDTLKSLTTSNVHEIQTSFSDMSHRLTEWKSGTTETMEDTCDSLIQNLKGILDGATSLTKTK